VAALKPNRKLGSSGGADFIVAQLGRVYGNAPASTRIRVLRSRSPQLDQFDWLLLVMSLEIDLKVRIPPRLVEPKDLSIARFAKSVAALPKVESPQHTLESLEFLAHALLGDNQTASLSKITRKRPR